MDVSPCFVWCVDSPGFGGSEINLMRVLGMIPREGVCVLHGEEIDPRLSAHFTGEGFDAHPARTGNTIRYMVGGVLQALRLIRDYPWGVFIIWAHHLDSNRWLQFVLALARMRYVVVEQFIPASPGTLRRSRLTAPIKRLVARRAFATVVNARSQVKHYRSLLSLPETARVIAVVNSRDVAAVHSAVELHRRDVRSLRTRLRLSDAPVITCVARLALEKDQATLIEAVARAGCSGAAPVLILVGDGPTRQSLQDLAHTLLAGRCIFVGQSPDPVPWLAASDLFVLPSLSEGLPGALLEAMAAALPCIATDIPGNRDLVADGKTGLLVSPGDVPGLAAAIRRLLDDRAFAAKLGANGYELVLQEYDERQERLSWIDLLQQCGYPRPT